MNFDFRTNHFINELLVCLMLIHAISVHTVFSTLQHALELILFVLFSLLLIGKALKKDELLLLYIFIASQIGSLLLNDLGAFLLGFKQMGLAVLAVIYFRRHACQSVFIHGAFFLCLVLVLLQYFVTNGFPLEIDDYLTHMRTWTNYKPLGIFLDYHASAYFLAVCFLGYLLQQRWYLFDFFVLILMDVKTSLISYFGQRVVSLLKIRVPILGSYYLQLILVIAVVSLTILFIPVFIEILTYLNLYHGISADIILSQMADPRTYIDAIHVFPRDIVQYYDLVARDYTGIGGNKGHSNELMLIVIMVQGGCVLAFSYLYFLTKSLPTYRVFIFLTLFHYAYVLTPLIIYTMYMFELRLGQRRDDLSSSKI